jgi:glycosyltransferase involved in cell wall biosynthesis
VKIAILHSHLNRGGVTHVVLNHVRALHTLPDQLLPDTILLLHGGRRAGFPNDLPERLQRVKIREVVISDLEYDEGGPANPKPLTLANRIETALREVGCVAENTLLHVHNHALGKNVSLPGAVGELADRRFGVLLQVHDFAEDCRPANYLRLRRAIVPHESERLPDFLYPQATHIHYAVLNRRDWSVLHDAGVDAGQLHLLPNPVLPPEQGADRLTARRRAAKQFGIGTNDRYLLYPVRGIRRKNLGEALLWAAAGRSQAAFGFTLPPLNPNEQASYARWRALAAELQLRCHFEVGGEGGLSLADNLAACDRVLTTSLAEGFGLVFLEACLSRRPLVGRDLPEITRDFVQVGVTFTGLQPRVDVPIDWIGRNALLDMLDRTFNATLRSYGRAILSRRALDYSLERKLQSGCIDFGDLNADLQERVIREVHRDAASKEMLGKLNPFLQDGIASHDAEYSAEAERNAEVVTRRYSLEVSGQQLMKVYQCMMASPQGPRHALNHGERILDAFLSLPRFRPARL